MSLVRLCCGAVFSVGHVFAVVVTLLIVVPVIVYYYGW